MLFILYVMHFYSKCMPEGQSLNITRSSLGKLYDVHTDSVNFLCSLKFYVVFLLNCGDRIVLQCGIFVSFDKD